jgi:hypothetical protein
VHAIDWQLQAPNPFNFPVKLTTFMGGEVFNYNNFSTHPYL